MVFVQLTAKADRQLKKMPLSYTQCSTILNIHVAKHTIIIDLRCRLVVNNNWVSTIMY